MSSKHRTTIAPRRLRSGLESSVVVITFGMRLIAPNTRCSVLDKLKRAAKARRYVQVSFAAVYGTSTWVKKEFESAHSRTQCADIFGGRRAGGTRCGEHVNWSRGALRKRHFRFVYFRF